MEINFEVSEIHFKHVLAKPTLWVKDPCTCFLPCSNKNLLNTCESIDWEHYPDTLL